MHRFVYVSAGSTEECCRVPSKHSEVLQTEMNMSRTWHVCLCNGTEAAVIHLWASFGIIFQQIALSKWSNRTVSFRNSFTCFGEAFIRNNFYLTVFKNRFSWMVSRIPSKMTVFCDVAPWRLVEVYPRFRGAFCFHHRPDDGGSKHLWNVFKILPDYTAQHPTRQSSSYSPP
jgi:hypothetical protein